MTFSSARRTMRKPTLFREILELLVALKKEGKTVFLSSHILPEVEQICDHVVILDRGRLVCAGRIREMLAPADRIQIVADRITPELEQTVRERGATVEHGPNGVRILMDAASRREMAEALWSNGCDVISIIPAENSLEDLFLELVERGKDQE
jgi:ABC-2 type transport system ATP-binding protein